MILANLTHACHPDKIYIIIIISSIFPSAIRDKILHLKNTKSRRRLDRTVVVSLNDLIHNHMCGKKVVFSCLF
jgi:hypothetical protein